MKHYSEDELILYYYGELPKPAIVDRHLDECAECSAAFRAVSGTLSLVVAPSVPERGELYGLEVWQKIRHQLPPQDESWWTSWSLSWRWLTVAGAAAALSLVVAIGFIAGRAWPSSHGAPATADDRSGVAANANSGDAAASNAARQRVLLASVADHLDRSDRVLTDIMNAPAGGNISAEQRWADDLLATSRLYRQDAQAIG